MRRVHDEVDINPSGNCAVGRLPFINYLDTASATDNCIENIQHLNGDYPSRAQREVYVNDILISSVRPNLLHNCIVKQKVPNLIASTGYIQVRLKAESSVDPDFLYYYLTAPANVEKYVNVAATAQSSYPSFNKDVIEDLVLPEIDVGIQRRVGRFLSSIDRLIQLSRKRIENLENLAKEIYDYWFVQFDFPDKNGKPYKTSGGKMVYNPQLKREIPDGWEVKEFGDVATFRNGINYDKSEGGDAEYRIINVRNISESTLLIDPSALDAIILKRSLADKYRITNNDIIIARSGTPGETRLICRCVDCIFCGFIICCTPCNDSLRHYLAFWLRSIQASLTGCSNGSILKNVNQGVLQSQVVVIPQDETIEQFNGIVKKVIGSVDLAMHKVSELTQLREFLLPLLMNGQAKLGGAAV